MAAEVVQQFPAPLCRLGVVKDTPRRHPRVSAGADAAWPRSSALAVWEDPPIFLAAVTAECPRFRVGLAPLTASRKSDSRPSMAQQGLQSVQPLDPDCVLGASRPGGRASIGLAWRAGSQGPWAVPNVRKTCGESQRDCVRTASDTGPGAECVSEGRLELPANGPTREVKNDRAARGVLGDEMHHESPLPAFVPPDGIPEPAGEAPGPARRPSHVLCQRIRPHQWVIRQIVGEKARTAESCACCKSDLNAPTPGTDQINPAWWFRGFDWPR